jgi:hypothetical protein
MGPAGKLRIADFSFLHDQADGCFKLVQRRIDLRLFIGSVKAAMTLLASWLDQPRKKKNRVPES